MTARKFKVGEFVSSADPHKTVLTIVEDPSRIAEFEGHHSFIRWLPMVDATEAIKSVDELMTAHRFNLACLVPSEVHSKLFALRVLLAGSAEPDPDRRNWPRCSACGAEVRGVNRENSPESLLCIANARVTNLPCGCVFDRGVR